MRVWPLVLVLVFASSPLLADVGDDAYLGRVVGDSVRLRTRPTLNHRVVELVNTGERLIVVGSDGEWLEVRVPGGVACWVRGDMIDVRGDEAVVVRTKVLMRPTAGQDYLPLEGRLDKDEKLRVLDPEPKGGTEPGWIRILAPARITVWIHGKYVERAGAVPEDRTALAETRLKRLQSNLRGEEAADTAAKRDDALRARVRKVAQTLASVEDGPETGGVLAGLLKELEVVLSEAEFRLTRVEATSVYKDVLLLQKERELAKARSEAELTEEQLRKAIRDADLRYRQSLEELAKLAPVREMEFTSIGWVRLRKGAWVIDKGGITLYVLQSKLYSMKDFAGKKVGVRGPLIGEDPARGVRIIDVESVEIFSD